MKPADARTKQCVISGRDRCVAHECMGWRWKRDVYRLIQLPIEPPCEADGTASDAEPPRPAKLPARWMWSPATDTHEAGWIETLEEAMERGDGYCGLAGKEGAP